VTADQQLSEAITVHFEQGKRRVFACALDWPGWPGWCRRDKSEELALEQLAAHVERQASLRRNREGPERMSGSTPGVEQFGAELPGMCLRVFGWPECGG
jgi:hypothetical protein